MNIQIILLSVYLYFTLDILKISDALLLNAQVLNAISSVDTIKEVQNSLQNKNSRVYYMLDAFKNEAEKLCFGISNQVHDLEMKTKESTMIMLKDLQIKRIHEIISSISKSHTDIGQVMNENIDNNTYMIDYLESFVQIHENLDIERALIDYLDEPFLGSKTLIKLLIERLQLNHQQSSTISSTNKLIHEFYSSMMLAAGKGQSFFELCYKLIDFYSGSNFKFK